MFFVFIKGVSEYLFNVCIIFDKFYVVVQVLVVLDKIWWFEQKIDFEFKGLCWVLFKDCDWFNVVQCVDFDVLVVNVIIKCMVCVWFYWEQLCEILDCKQINVVFEMFEQWCINVMCFKVEFMKEVVCMI